MTLLLQRSLSRPGTHALVIGVSRYRYMRQELAVARYSADWMVRWLATRFRNPGAELASIELFRYGHHCSDLEHVEGYTPQGVGEPTHQAVESAAAAWMKRADRHQDNIAFFYYAGPGFARGSDSLLLFDDFKGPPPSGGPTRGVTNFLSIPAAMRGCRARRQVYLLDVDRVAGLDDFQVEPLLRSMAPVSPPPLQAIIYGAAPGQRALPEEGESRTISLFAEALTEALDKAEPDSASGAVSVRGLAARAARELAAAAGRLQREQRLDARVADDFDFHYPPGTDGIGVATIFAEGPDPGEEDVEEVTDPASDEAPLPARNAERRPPVPARPGRSLKRIGDWIATHRDRIAIQLVSGGLIALFAAALGKIFALF